MSKHKFAFICPNCTRNLEFEYIALEMPQTIKGFCTICYYPLVFYPSGSRCEIRTEPPKKVAFLIHSSKPEEKELLSWFRALLGLYGVQTRVIEEDPRSVDWLQKSLDGINASDFVISFLTKRYQYANESGVIQGWKAPDKCYEEIAIGFALRKDLYALVEKDVESGNVLQTRAWCYPFEKKAKPAGTPIEADSKFFQELDNYLGI